MQISRVAVWTAAALALTACGQSIEVRTMAAPGTGFAALHSFRVLPAPARRDGRPVTGADDPMINNSIANRALRDAIVRGFQGRGYSFSELSPGFEVAFYASAREKLDVTVWDYGYPFHPRWRFRVPPAQTITQYTEGSVVIDVIDPRTRELLWRGEGTARLSDNTSEDLKLLAKAAESIVAKFPRASATTVAVSH